MAQGPKPPEYNEIKYGKAALTELDKLSSECQAWERTEYKSATTRLYSLLAEIYSVYEQKFVKTTDDKRRALRNMVIDRLKASGMRVHKSPETLGLLIRYVFKTDRRRVLEYKNAIAAAKSHAVLPANLPQWLADQGGIDGVSKKLTQSDEAEAKQKIAAMAYNAVVKQIGDAYQAPLGTVNLQCDAAGSEVMMLAKSCGNGQFNIVYVFDQPSDGLKNMLIRKAAAANVKDEAENKAVAEEAASFSNKSSVSVTEEEIAV